MLNTVIQLVKKKEAGRFIFVFYHTGNNIEISAV